MSVRAFYKTKAGSELPLLNLRGKEYLQVPHRLVWFREEKPDWQIETSLVKVDGTSCLARAVIRDAQGNVMATAHKFEKPEGFPDYIEKAETGAVGRALLMIGFGTAFCADELDEGSRLADSPVDPVGMTKVGDESSLTNTRNLNQEVKASKPTNTSSNHASQANASDWGKFKCEFGRKYKGHSLESHPIAEWEAYMTWLKDTAVRDGTSLSRQVQEFENAFEIFKKQKAGQS